MNYRLIIYKRIKGTFSVLSLEGNNIILFKSNVPKLIFLGPIFIHVICNFFNLTSRVLSLV
ncbi:hypothetical protein HanRHA438_Chr16g0757901 [Helianthus annuus]|nr:hypothetical protein HanRHA438_Chr16g0757901 [Helianthus annuus]